MFSPWNNHLIRILLLLIVLLLFFTFLYLFLLFFLSLLKGKELFILLVQILLWVVEELYIGLHPCHSGGSHGDLTHWLRVSFAHLTLGVKVALVVRMPFLFLSSLSNLNNLNVSHIICSILFILLPLHLLLLSFLFLHPLNISLVESWFPLSNMVGQTFFTKCKHESETQLESTGLDEVTLTTDYERTSSDVHTCWWSFTNLLSIYPVNLR